MAKTMNSIRFNSWRDISFDFIKSLPEGVDEIIVFDDDVEYFRVEKEDGKWVANIVGGSYRPFTAKRLYPSSIYKYVLSACSALENKGKKPFVEFYNSNKGEDYAYTFLDEQRTPQRTYTLEGKRNKPTKTGLNKLENSVRKMF